MRFLSVAGMHFKFDLAADFCKQGMIASLADIKAGMNVGPVLTHNNTARRYILPAVAFYPEHLRVAVTAIS